MKKSTLRLFASGGNNYLLLLIPPDSLGTSIIALKKRFAADYPLSITRSKPHFTLATFRLQVRHESLIIRRLKQVAMYTAPFEVELKDYGKFQQPNTIFIDVVSRTSIQDLVREIRSKMRGYMKSYSKPHFIMTPHLTIARQISESQFDKAWIEYSRGVFSGNFIAQSMVLLKHTGTSKGYTIVCHLPFENLSNPVKQAYLFG